MSLPFTLQRVWDGTRRRLSILIGHCWLVFHMSLSLDFVPGALISGGDKEGLMSGLKGPEEISAGFNFLLGRKQHRNRRSETKVR